MKAFIFLSLLILCSLTLSGTRVTAQTHDLLTNASVVKLVKASFKEKTIISIIGSSPTKFDLSTERMIELKKAGVTEKVILAMLARQQGLNFDENWSDDNFDNQGNAGVEKIDRQNDPLLNPSASGGGNSTDIFGSSGGYHGSTRSSGGQNGSAGGDTITTGSATVRIIRPNSETGGAAPAKLEKVATLKNDSIVELIEAGFSEGTIIRRIEQSPVDFDLSPAKVADLRRHRVTDKIISAMKAASGESSESSSTPNSNGLSRQ
jgi:hypothetical protein